MQFHETIYGQRFFSSQLPSLIKAINRLADTQEKNVTPSQVDFPKLDDETRQRLQKVMEDPIKCSAFALNLYGQIDSDDEKPSSVGFHMARAILNNNIEEFLIAVVGWSSKSLLDLMFSEADNVEEE